MTAADIENEFRKASIEIADRLSEMQQAEPRQRRKEYLAVLALLLLLRRNLYVWLKDFLRAFSRSENSKLVGLTGQLADLSDSQLDAIAAGAFASAYGYFNRSITSIQSLASSLQTDRGAMALRRLVGNTQSPSDIRRKLREKLVSVLAQNGRYFSYEPGYYAGMVSQAAEAKISESILDHQAQKIGSDLVQVMGPPSKHALCEKMRGRVFSLSGAHEFAEPASMVPGTAGRAHMNCKHYFRVVGPDEFDVSELRQLAHIGPDLRDLLLA